MVGNHTKKLAKKNEMIFDKVTEYDYIWCKHEGEQADFPYKECIDVGIPGLEST
jgi:hypothetical protein